MTAIRKTCAAAVVLAIVSLLACSAPAAPTAAPAKPPTAATTAPTAPAGGAVPTAATSAAPTQATAATPAAAAPRIKRGGTLRAAHSWTIPSFDPHLSTWFSAVGYELYDAFLRYDMVQESPVKFDVRPELAESWEMPDPKTLILRIRSGVKFHDGTDFDVNAAKWNLDRI